MFQCFNSRRPNQLLRAHVRCLMVQTSMLANLRSRMWVAVLATALAESFGAVGLWQRNHVLSQQFFMGQTLWESTARFHIWPWPFKVAAIWAFPAFFGGSIVMMPVNLLIGPLPEAAELLPAGALALLLWYWVAARLERYAPAIRWASRGVFLVLILTGALLPLGYTGWFPFGVLAWCVATLLLRMSRHNVKADPAPSA